MINKIKVDTDEIRKLRSCLKTNIGSIIKTHNNKKQSIHSKMQSVINEYGNCSEICSEARAIISLLEEADRAVRRMTPRYEDIISGLEYTVSSTKQCERDIKRIIGIESIEQPHVRDRNTRKVSTRRIEADSDLIEEEQDELEQDELCEEEIWGYDEAQATIGETQIGEMLNSSLEDGLMSLSVNTAEIGVQANYMSMQKQITESQKAIGCYAKAIEDKQLDKINTYTNMLMDSRKEDKPDPQWLLDALGMLGVPYMTLGQTANIMNRTVLSTEKFKEAKAKLQTTMDDLQSRLFSKENIEKLQNLWENSLKQYETQRTLSLENLQKRLEECEFEPLTEEEIAFYNDLPNILSEVGTKLPPDKQANLLSCLHIKGNVEAVDLKRFGLTAENGIDESTLEELSKAITLKYDANYYTNLEAEKKAQEAELWKDFWDEVNAPIEQFNQSIVDDIGECITDVENFVKDGLSIGEQVIKTGAKIVLDTGSLGFDVFVEAPARLGELGLNWIQKEAGLLTEEEFNQRLDQYCAFADQYVGEVQSVELGLIDWGAQTVFFGVEILCMGLEFLEKAHYANEGLNNDSFFEKAKEKTREWSNLTSDYLKGISPNQDIIEETKVVASVVAITKSLAQLLKGAPKAMAQNGDEVAEALKGAKESLDDIGNIVVNGGGTISATGSKGLRGILEGLGAIVDDLKGTLEVVVASDIALESATAIEVAGALEISGVAVGGLTGGGLPPDDNKGEGKADDFVGVLRGENITLPNVKGKTIEYKKVSTKELDTLRKSFESTEKKKFLKSLTDDEAIIEKLKKSGLDDIDIQKLKDGLVPKGYQVHHKIPLDGGGTNSFDNLILIKNEPYHKVITNAQRTLTSSLKEGDTVILENWPIPGGIIYPSK